MVGWIIQAIGHVYEGRKPAFVDDLMGQSFQIRNPNAVASCGCGTKHGVTMDAHSNPGTPDRLTTIRGNYDGAAKHRTVIEERPWQWP